ncbi:two-on-two hemoglobin-3, partial [Tanacetum coccineum]
LLPNFTKVQAASPKRNLCSIHAPWQGARVQWKFQFPLHSCSLAGSTSAMKVSNWGGHLHFRKVGEVYEDEEEWFRSIFADSKKEDAIQNQYEFFVQRMGGPPLFSQRRDRDSGVITGDRSIAFVFGMAC